MKNSKGFSVIELIIVIGIMAIITTIAIPEFTKWKTKYSIESDVKSIENFIQQVRMKAFTEKINLKIVSGTGSICFKCSSSDTDCISKYGTANISCLKLENQFFIPNITVSKRGTLNNTNIRYTGSYTGEINFDCVAVKNIRIKIGKWNGSKCIIK